MRIEVVINEFKNKDLDVDDPEYNKYQTCIENKNTERLKTSKLPELYPHLDDEEFSKKIFLKKEFNETKYDIIDPEKDFENFEKKVNILCQKKDFQLSPHQMFVRNFLSFETPYNSLLLYHGLGTGKTCSSISITEEMRDYLKQVNIRKKLL